MRSFILLAIFCLLFSFEIRAEHAGSSASAGRPAASASDKERAMKALALLFKDPISGEEETGGYKVYLNYQKERLLLVEKMSEADSPLNRQILARKLNQLDQDARIFNSKVMMSVDLASAIAMRVFDDGSALDRIKDKNPEAFESWENERKVLIEELQKSHDGLKRQVLAKKLNHLDEGFRLRHLGFLLSQ